MINVHEVEFIALESDPAFAPMLALYAAESALLEMPPTNPQFDYYKQMEAAELLFSFGAYREGELIGFLLMTVAFIPHYGERIAGTESFYVLPEHRKSGAGLRLLKRAEASAKFIGARGFYVSAPAGGKLDRVMTAMPGYREASRVYFRGLPCEA